MSSFEVRAILIQKYFKNYTFFAKNEKIVPENPKKFICSQISNGGSKTNPIRYLYNIVTIRKFPIFAFVPGWYWGAELIYLNPNSRYSVEP